MRRNDGKPRNRSPPKPRSSPTDSAGLHFISNGFLPNEEDVSIRQSLEWKIEIDKTIKKKKKRLKSEGFKIKVVEYSITGIIL